MIKTLIKGVRSDHQEDQIQPYNAIVDDVDFETFTLFRYTLPKFFENDSHYAKTLFTLLTKRNMDGLLPAKLRNYIDVNGHTDGAFGFLYYNEVELLLEELKKVKPKNSELKKFIKNEYKDSDLVEKLNKIVDDKKIMNHLIKEFSKINNGDIVICSLNKLRS